MNIEDYLARPIESTDEACIKSPWLDLGQLPLASGRLSVGDTTYFPHEQVIVDLPLGLYLIQAKVYTYGHDHRIACLRAIQVEVPVEQQHAGEISVDFADVGFCDHAVFGAALERIAANPDLVEHEYLAQFEKKPLAGTVTLPGEPPAIMFRAASGWGDGGYPVYCLFSQLHAIGLEVVFIEEDEEYLFGNVDSYYIIRSQPE